MDIMHPFLWPAVLGQNCADYGRDFIYLIALSCVLVGTHIGATLSV